MALRLADGRSESPWETLLRLLHVLCEVPVQPQAELVDVHGDFVGRADLLISGTRTAHEYDGAHHLTRDQQRRDLDRARRLDRAGFARHGYTDRDVLFRAVAVLRDADRALGREHRPERIRRWHAELGHSLFTAAGGARLRHIWQLQEKGEG